MTIAQAEGTRLTIVGTATGNDRDGGSADVVTTRGIAIVLATRVDSLDNKLRIGTVVGSDVSGATGREDGRRECKCMEVGTFG